MSLAKRTLNKIFGNQNIFKIGETLMPDWEVKAKCFYENWTEHLYNNISGQNFENFDTEAANDRTCKTVCKKDI